LTNNDESSTTTTTTWPGRRRMTRPTEDVDAMLFLFLAENNQYRVLRTRARRKKKHSVRREHAESTYEAVLRNIVHESTQKLMNNNKSSTTTTTTQQQQHGQAVDA
jgi:hypothetical protein